MAGGALLRPGNARDAADARRGRAQAPRPLSRLAAALALGLAGCATLLAGGGGQLERTWRAAQIWVPGAALSERRPQPLTGRMAALTEVLDRLPSTVSAPVVIYAHDCPGPGPDLAVWADLLVRQGYAVVAPDSRARSDGATARCGTGDTAMLATRAAEIQYAVLQVSTLSWVRQSAVFLLAVGQGATAAARDDGRSVTASVLVGAVEGASRRVSPTLVLDEGTPSRVPSQDEQRKAVDFLRRLTPR